MAARLASTCSSREASSTGMPVAFSDIKDGSVVVEDKNGDKTEIAADSVIVSVGYVPAPVAKKSGHVHVIGDANKVGNLRTVVWNAWKVAEKI